MLGFHGPPRKLINLALAKKIVMFGSSESYEEFREKIFLPKFSKYLKNQIFTPEKLDFDYRSFINIIDVGDILDGINVVKEDPDDDVYFRVAKASGSRVIVSGDKAVLNVKKYDDIIVVSPEKFVKTMLALNCS